MKREQIYMAQKRQLPIKVTDPLAAAAQSVTPPPNKLDLLRAAAIAMHEEQLAASIKVQNEVEAIIGQIKCDALTRLKLPENAAEVSVMNHYTHGVVIELQYKLDKDLSERFKKTDGVRLPMVEPAEQIFERLKRHANQRTHVVKALVRDPEVKAKLLKLGHSLLNQAESIAA